MADIAKETATRAARGSGAAPVPCDFRTAINTVSSLSGLLRAGLIGLWIFLGPARKRFLRHCNFAEEDPWFTDQSNSPRRLHSFWCFEFCARHALITIAQFPRHHTRR